jgi:hypothetical protein
VVEWAEASGNRERCESVYRMMMRMLCEGDKSAGDGDYAEDVQYFHSMVG